MKAMKPVRILIAVLTALLALVLQAGPFAIAFATHAEAALAGALCQFGGILDLVMDGVDDDEIIADAVHLGKAHFYSSAGRVTRAKSISAILSISCTAMHSKRPWQFMPPVARFGQGRPM